MIRYTRYSGVHVKADGTLYGLCACDPTGASRPLTGDAESDTRPVCYDCAGVPEPAVAAAPVRRDTYTRTLQGAREAAAIELGWEPSRRFSY